jgi:hypothetical protein
VWGKKPNRSRLLQASKQTELLARLAQQLRQETGAKPYENDVGRGWAEDGQKRRQVVVVARGEASSCMGAAQMLLLSEHWTIQLLYSHQGSKRASRCEVGTQEKQEPKKQPDGWDSF